MTIHLLFTNAFHMKAGDTTEARGFERERGRI